jgi:hypothetical protein
MTTTILTVAPPGTWSLDPVHSWVDFEVSYLAGTFNRRRSRTTSPSSPSCSL